MGATRGFGILAVSLLAISLTITPAFGKTPRSSKHPHTRSPSVPTLPIAYDVQMQVRATPGGDAFNLPNGSTFNSVSPSLNNSGNVAVKVNTVGLTTSPGLWFGGRGQGFLAHDANDNEAILGDPFLNNNNKA